MEKPEENKEGIEMMAAKEGQAGNAEAGGQGQMKKPLKNPFGNMTAQQFLTGWQQNIEKKKKSEENAAKNGDESGTSPTGKDRIRRKSSKMAGQGGSSGAGGLADAAGGNLVLKDALANLISVYGKS